MKRTRKPLTEQVKERTHKREDKTGPPSTLLIPTGCTNLDLACSDSIRGGYGAGKMVNLIGDSSSGKTLLALTMFAELNLLKEFDSHRFIYDDVECACEFDIGKLLGKKTESRMEYPQKDEEPDKVYTIEEWQYNVEILLKSGDPVVYVLDSFDALSSKDECIRTEKALKAHKEGKELSGSYRMEKPKIAGEILRQIVGRLKSTKSLLLIISQTRDNIDPMSFQKKTRSGGNALRFYASHEIWLAVVEKIKRRNRIVGSRIRAKVTKNKLTGKQRTCEFLVDYSIGVDDVGSCVDFMIDEGLWQKSKLTYDVESLGVKGVRDSMVKQIEDRGLEGQLREEVQGAWLKIEDDLKVDRKPRFK